MFQIGDTVQVVLFFLFFAGFWVFVTWSLGKKAGWFRLAERYPDQEEGAVRRLRCQSGQLGGVAMSGILHLDVCPSGLRIAMLKLFGLFHRKIFVPWSEIAVQRKRKLFSPVAELRFGRDESTLEIPDYVANQIARSVPERWPEPGNFPPQTIVEAGRIVLVRWMLMVAGIALLFAAIPSLLAGHRSGMPAEVIGCFAIVLGIPSLRDLLARIRR